MKSVAVAPLHNLGIVLAGCFLVAVAPFLALKPSFYPSSFLFKDAMIVENNRNCDFSEEKTDVCELASDIRIQGNSSTIFVSTAQPGTETLKLKPYARKWDKPVMELIKELSLKPISSKEAPQCDVKHSVPAIAFSTGGYYGNLFHEFSDVLIPLFQTSYSYRREVQLLISDLQSWWVDKYKAILDNLSSYEVIDLRKDGRVHCFHHCLVGLKRQKELRIDPSMSPNNYSIAEFKQFLRASYSLGRNSVKRQVNKSSMKPELLFMSRKGSRAIINEEEVIQVAQGLGYEVTVARPEATKDIPKFAKIVNGCDVMIGVHGAGHTNMVFLPNNATLISIVPLGLKFVDDDNYKIPAIEMGLRALQYLVSEEESSLVKQYPTDNEVFGDPSLYMEKHGWQAFYDVFLLNQTVTIDVGRIKKFFMEAIRTPIVH